MNNTLFITGNKRSGTSQLVRLLNLHPNIFISHESDIIWILYQLYNNKSFAPYPWDSPRGMEYTLKACGGVLEKNNSPTENFFAALKCLMEKGSPWLPAIAKKDLLWIGDKKPFQYSDPALTEFIHNFFPKTVFIHLIRHPFAVALSAQRFNKTADGDFWKGLSLKESVEKWTKHEKDVLRLKQSGWAKVLDVKYEDLCKHTGEELKRIFNFLGLEYDQDIIKEAAKNTRHTVKKIPKVPCSEETRSIMGLYGYTPEEAEQNDLKIFFINTYWKLRKKLL